MSTTFIHKKKVKPKKCDITKIVNPSHKFIFLIRSVA
jgi:hypothetical protein